MGLPRPSVRLSLRLSIRLFVCLSFCPYVTYGLPAPKTKTKNVKKNEIGVKLPQGRSN